MHAYLWTVITIEIIGVLLHLRYLVTGKVETPTTAGTRAFVIIFNLCFIAWAAYLLLKH